MNMLRTRLMEAGLSYRILSLIPRASHAGSRVAEAQACQRLLSPSYEAAGKMMLRSARASKRSHRSKPQPSDHQLCRC